MSKIIIQNDGPGAHMHERLGLARVLAYCGHNVAFWDIAAKPAFDIFSEVEPDIFLGQSYNLSRPVMKCILARPKLQVILKLGDWGEFYDDKDEAWHHEYPILMATEEDKTNVHILQEAGNFQFGFIHYHPYRTAETHGHWTKNDVGVISLMNAADIFEYTNGSYMDELACDCSMVGGSWSYKSRTIDRYVIPLCNPHTNLNVKIFGKSDWGISQYCGPLPTGMAKNLFRSTIVNLNIHEQHSQDFGFDLNERTFKVLIAKGFMVSDYVEGLRELYGDDLVMAKTPTDYMEQVMYFIQNPEKRHAYINKGYTTTLNNHTYFDRCLSIFDKLGLDTESITDGKTRAMKEFGL